MPPIEGDSTCLILPSLNDAAETVRGRTRIALCRRRRHNRIKNWEDQMLHEQELLDRAGTYRDMAKTALALVLRVEFNERAERYETAASMVKRHRDPPARPKPTE
jgi:hypothetical protein